MKICVTANTAWSMYNFRHGLLLFWLKSGFTVTVIAPEDESSEKLREMGCTVVDLPMSAKGINPFEDLLLVYRLTNLYRKFRPDFIFHYTIKPNIYGSVAARILSIPSIAITTGLGYIFLNNNLVSKIAKKMYKFSFTSPKEIWFLNEEDKHSFLENSLVSEKQAVLLHGEGVNTEFFVPLNKPVEDNKIRFLLVARMLWDKGVGDFVEAARIVRAKYPNTVFQLLGACGVPNPSVISRDEVSLWEAEGVVEYLGVTTDVRPYVAQSDCMVLPSFYREGVPRTLLEAAAMGKPLITTDNVGCRDVVVDGKTGFLCPIKDPIALASRMMQFIVLADDKKIEMGHMGREFVEDKFDEKKIISQYMSTLEKYGIKP